MARNHIVRIQKSNDGKVVGKQATEMKAMAEAVTKKDPDNAKELLEKNKVKVVANKTNKPEVKKTDEKEKENETDVKNG